MARLRDKFQDKFIFGYEDSVIQSVENKMAKRYINWRHKIHTKFLEFKTFDAALASRPPLNIKGPDWFYLCYLFNSEKFMVISDRNKKNRAKLESTHCAGTKAFPKTQYEKVYFDVFFEINPDWISKFSSF